MTVYFYDQIQFTYNNVVVGNDADYYAHFYSTKIQSPSIQARLRESQQLNNLKNKRGKTRVTLLKSHVTLQGGALMKQPADDDRLNKELSRIEDREYFFNDLLNCISVELQELEAWVNNLSSGVDFPVINNPQLNDWVNNQSGEKTPLTTHHYRVLYGGKLKAELALVEGRYVSKFTLTSGGTSYKSPYNFHSCLSKQPKNASSLQT